MAEKNLILNGPKLREPTGTKYVCPQSMGRTKTFMKNHLIIYSFYFCKLSFADLMQLGLLIGAIITAFILYKTLREGQRQSEESRKQTGYSLAINQYIIFYEDLKGLIQKFKEMNFYENIKKINDFENIFSKNFKKALEQANGMNSDMILLFVLFLAPERRTRTEDQVSSFKINILFPLLREYKNLLDFLIEVKEDDLLGVKYKKKFYRIIERDILQSYFRICNYCAGTSLGYDLSCFPEDNLDNFYAINKFYKANDLFQYQTFEFYQNVN